MLSVRQFAQRKDEFYSRGVALVRIFHSPVESLRSFGKGEHAVPFPVLADPEKQVYRAYAVHRGVADVLAMFKPSSLGRAWEAHRAGIRVRFRDSIRDGMTGRPADFLSDAEAKILRLHRGRTFTDSLRPDALHGWLDELRIGRR